MANRSDQNRLGGRVKRYTRVTSKVGAFAARAAGDRLLGSGKDHKNYAFEMKEILGSLKGPMMKVAQLLATIPDVLPQAYAQELSQLQSNAPPMGWAFVKRRMRAELGPNWQSQFAEFEHHAIAAASLGQVHKARDHGGQTLALKLQYPEMASAVEADLKQLSLLLSLFKRYDPSIDTSEIKQELMVRLREELDYVLEAKHIKLYADMLTHETQVHVPHVIEDYSTPKLLCMNWLEGQPLLNFKDHNQESRNKIARNLFRAWYVPFHQYGIIHGDPHLGNYTVRDDLSLNLLDFGCVRKFPPEFVGGVIDLYTALRTGDQSLAVHAYEIWGFKNLSQELIDTLNIWASFLYGPLMQDKTRLINDAPEPGEYGREQVFRVRKRLKELGPITPPREFVFMDRAAIGLGGVFLHLRAELNWHQMFHEIIDGFNVEDLAQKQNKVLIAAGLPSAEDHQP